MSTGYLENISCFLVIAESGEVVPAACEFEEIGIGENMGFVYLIDKDDKVEVLSPK